MHKSSAWPLALLYTALIVYASLFPFADWRDQGLNPFSFLWQPLPRYWTWFDVCINVLGYLPFGFLLCVGCLRSDRVAYAVLIATIVATLLSLGMETTQSYLVRRVASNVDLALNSAGAFSGAVCASLLHRVGGLAYWSRIRSRWFVPKARGGIVLLASWPFALLFPTAVPLGLGQVVERLEAGLADWLADTPYLKWLPVREIELQPLLPGPAAVCIALGLLIPCLLAYCVVRGGRRRAVTLLALLSLAVGVTALSAALGFGPQHAWDWLDEPSRAGLLVALILASLLLFIPQRVAAALALLALGIYLALLNQATVGPYFLLAVNGWEQGQFIRFHGLAQWLAWIWPFALLVYLVALISARDGKT